MYKLPLDLNIDVFKKLQQPLLLKPILSEIDVICAKNSAFYLVLVGAASLLTEV